MDWARRKWWDATASMHNAVMNFREGVASSLDPAVWRKASITKTQRARTLTGTHKRILQKKGDSAGVLSATKQAQKLETNAARASVIASALGVFTRPRPPVPPPSRRFNSNRIETSSLPSTQQHLQKIYKIPNTMTMLGKNQEDLQTEVAKAIVGKTTLKDLTLQNTKYKRAGSEKWVPHQQGGGAEAHQAQWIDAGSMSGRRIPHDSSKKWLYLFHGTTNDVQANLLNGIKKQAAKNTVFDNGFYTTPSPGSAITYAFLRKKQRPGSTAILTIWRIGISRLDSLIYGVDFRIGHHPGNPYYIIFTSDKGARELNYVETIVMNFEN